jgi:Zn-dependent M28 family amino/carboxypeptidase
MPPYADRSHARALRRFARCLPALLASLIASPAQAQQPTIPPISKDEIASHVRFLSSDLLEGRGPATRGGAITELYLANQLRAYGVKPGNDTSYFQRVPIDIVASKDVRARAVIASRSRSAVAGSGDVKALRYPEDVVVWAGASVTESGANAPVVFVGYGSTAPEYRWDDFKNVDVKGKVLLVLVNDPPAPTGEPTLFGGKAMTYYGRWTYKFEEAERRGAAGMLIIHDNERAGYGWPTVVGSWAKEQRMLPRDPKLPAPLGFRGWITGAAADSLLRAAGHDLAQLRRSAESRSFRPVDTGIRLDVAFTNTVQHLESNNVLGLIEGTDPEAKGEYVMLSAHWDHLGIGPVVAGDSIYNGAVDNASGTANLLAVSRQLSRGERTKRSVLVAFVTAEESGLLGSEFLALNPVVPTADIVANLNVDGGNVHGETRDLTVLGDVKSSLGPSLAEMIKPRSMTLTPDAYPERGFFYRSDHFSFAKAGVPSVSIGEGESFIGKSADWSKQMGDEYTARRYHQPGDHFDESWEFTGAVQLSRIVTDFARLLGNSREWPTWNADAEFKRVPRKPAM